MMELYPSSVSEVELWSKILPIEVFALEVFALEWAHRSLVGENYLNFRRSWWREQNSQLFLKILVTEEMHWCLFHCLNFPMDGLSVRRSCRKTGQQRKGSVPEPYGVCCWCVLQMGVWRTWWHVGEGGMREIHGSRLQHQTSMKPGHHIEHGTIFQSNCQIHSSQILQWGRVWESSDWRMAQKFPTGNFQKSLHCNGNASKHHLLSKGLTNISAVHWWLTWWSWLNTEPIWVTGMFLQLKCGRVV